MDRPPASCERLASPSITNFAVSLLIFLGILVSYLPQHYRIVRRRSSLGLSPYFVLLGTISATCQLANIAVLPRSRADAACCKEISRFACVADLLGIAQIGVQWACFSVILVLFFIYFPRSKSSILAPAKDAEAPSPRTALAVTIACVVHGIITAGISLYLILAHPEVTQVWANILGIVSAVLALIQYLPQIYTTFKLKKVASLSIPMMCIQTPGGFLWAGSLAARLGPEGWSTWGVYVVTGCFQGTLLIMGLYFKLKDRRRRTAEEDDASQKSADHANGNPQSNDSSEQTPLLRSAE
ncbi:hypothetical protein GJ744_002396 [Endocarpon pusillum]|uniref:PQ loop repeat protein n=1 Tax=Endocarpon pusillum TaxID=364733 RepID=A0A8H7AQ21_9EURO|nr:hypothetical protein GJ744_002396 [Endocarpon pusillum]